VVGLIAMRRSGVDCGMLTIPWFASSFGALKATAMLSGDGGNP